MCDGFFQENFPSCKSTRYWQLSAAGSATHMQHDVGAVAVSSGTRSQRALLSAYARGVEWRALESARVYEETPLFPRAACRDKKEKKR